MYSTGKCSDLSFTFAGRPPITPFAVIDYLERALTKPRGNNTALNELIHQTNEALQGLDNRDALLAALDNVFDLEAVDTLRSVIQTPRTNFRSYKLCS